MTGNFLIFQLNCCNARILVCLKEIDVHIFTQEARDEMNLEERWRHPISEQEYEEREREIRMMLKGKYKSLDYMN